MHAAHTQSQYSRQTKLKLTAKSHEGFHVSENWEIRSQINLVLINIKQQILGKTNLLDLHKRLN